MENNTEVQKMKLLLNNKEIAHFLLSCIDHTTFLKSLPEFDHETSEFLAEFVRKNPIPTIKSNYTVKKKLKEKLFKAVMHDSRKYRQLLTESLAVRKENYYNLVHKNIDYFIDKIGLETIFKLYQQSDYKNFVKGTGLSIDPTGEFIRRKDFNDYRADCLIRNTVGNEDLLVTKVDSNFPFWFVDSGYTNFLEPNKKWHRLVRNHLHYGKYFDAPADRLGIFKSFPKPWRDSGDKILVIEPGPFAAQVFHVDLKSWKYDVETELKKYTDKKIVFREKAPKRERTRLYKELLNEDYYCIVNINSNAATEAIWAGVPAITLDRHITNPVTRNKLSDINDLYKGNIANWLCMLSYSQFTKEELMNGTAYNLVKKYNV